MATIEQIEALLHRILHSELVPPVNRLSALQKCSNRNIGRLDSYILRNQIDSDRSDSKSHQLKRLPKLIELEQQHSSSHITYHVLPPAPVEDSTVPIALLDTHTCPLAFGSPALRHYQLAVLFVVLLASYLCSSNNIYSTKLPASLLSLPLSPTASLPSAPFSSTQCSKNSFSVDFSMDFGVLSYLKKSNVTQAVYDIRFIAGNKIALPSNRVGIGDVFPSNRVGIGNYLRVLVTLRILMVLYLYS